MNDHILHYAWHDKPNLTHAKGPYLYDDKGNKYLDASAGAISNGLGQGREDMVEAIHDQYKDIAYHLRCTATTDVLYKVCDKLHEVTNMDRFFFVSGGTESTETAVSIALLHWRYQCRESKTKIIGRWQGYHGYSRGALSWGGNFERRRDFLPVLSDDGHIAPCYCYRCWFGRECESCHLECAENLEREILRLGPENVAAFICETVAGTSLAAAVPPDGYYQRIREICDKYDVLMICDEVMCGAGRTGKMLAIDHYGVKPDIVALAKAIGGGYFPVGMACVTDKVVDPIRNHGHYSPGFTWAGNPIAAATVLKALEIYEEEDLLKNVEEQGAYLKKRLEELAEKHPSMGDVRGIGLILGVEFVKDKETKECFDRELQFQEVFCNKALAHGLMINSACQFDMGERGDGVIIGTIFEITREQIDELVEKFDITLSETEAELM